MTKKQITGLWISSRWRAVPYRMTVWGLSILLSVFSWLMYASTGALLPVLLSAGICSVVSVLALSDLHEFRESMDSPPSSAPSRLIHPQTRHAIRAGIGDAVRRGL